MAIDLETSWTVGIFSETMVTLFLQEVLTVGKAGDARPS